MRARKEAGTGNRCGGGRRVDVRNVNFCMWLRVMSKLDWKVKHEGGIRDHEVEG